MTNFNSFSNHELVEDTKRWVQKETEATLSVLERLREIERRSVHLAMGYSSLHEFCVVELRYSDGAAYRRIHAMRLCEEVPEARAAISEGKLSLTTAASLQNHFKKEKYSSAAEKLELLEQVQGKSRRECEQILEPEKKGTPIQTVIDDETAENMRRLSELWAIPMTDMAALIKKMAAFARRQQDPVLKEAKAPKSASPEKLPNRYIARSTKKALWIRESSRCSFIDPISKRRCSSRYGLQIDHVVPFSCGGKSNLENLRLLCFAHHHLVTRRVFGEKAASARHSTVASTHTSNPALQLFKHIKSNT